MADEIVGSGTEPTRLRTGRPVSVRLAGRLSPTQRLKKRLRDDYRERMKKLATAKPEAFEAMLKQIYRKKVDDAKAKELADQARAGEFPVSKNIEFVDVTSIRGHNAAYARADGGTTYLNEKLKPSYGRLLDSYSEEAGHHLDALLKGKDTLGDEGSMLVAGLAAGGPIEKKDEKKYRRWRDAGKLNIKGKEIYVEFDTELPFKDENGQKIPLFMHSETFASANQSGWFRDDVELEAAMTLTGVEGKPLFELLEQRNRRNFRRLRRSSYMEAYSIGYPIDEIPWNGNAHDVREGRVPDTTSPVVQPYVWLKIEPGNFEIDPERNRRRLDLGTDIMDDIYYDTDGYMLLANSMSIRARKRWDSDTEMRRLLIALKVESGVDAFGIKRAAKTDVRRDRPTPEAITGLDEAVTRGLDSWNNDPAVPMERCYQRLLRRSLLSDAEDYKKVLILKPKAFLRSVRSRYHFNENSLSEIRSIHDLGKSHLEAIKQLANAARTGGTLPAGREAAVEDFEKKIDRMLDQSLLKGQVKSALAALDHDVEAAGVDSLLPGSTGPGSSNDLDDLVARRPILERRRVVAEAISTIYHELARDLDDGSSESLRRLITGTLERQLDDHAEWFVDWQKETNIDLAKLHTLKRFVELHAGMQDDQAQLDAFNTWGRDNERRFSDLNMDSWKLLASYLKNEQLRIWQRQLETAGSAALGLWFDEARQFYVPASRRQTGNFLIDTIDFAAMYKPDVWGDMPPPERNAAVDLTEPPYVDSLFHASLVNEVQIELLSGGEYTKRLKHLGAINELAGLFMRWADQAGSGGSEAQYKALFSELSGLGDEPLQERLAPFNDWLAKNGGQVTSLSAEEFKGWIKPEQLTAAVRDGTAEKDKRAEVAIEGTRFVFEKYRDMIGFISRLKEERIRDVIEDAGGPRTTNWVPATGSKGSIAIGMMRQAGE